METFITRKTQTRAGKFSSFNLFCCCRSSSSLVRQSKEADTKRKYKSERQQNNSQKRRRTFHRALRIGTIAAALFCRLRPFHSFFSQSLPSSLFSSSFSSFSGFHNVTAKISSYPATKSEMCLEDVSELY